MFPELKPKRKNDESSARRWPLILALLLVLGAGLLLYIVKLSEPKPVLPPNTGRGTVAYTVGNNRYTYNADTQETTLISDNAQAIDTTAKISPDGQHIARWQTDEATQQGTIIIENALTHEVEQVYAEQQGIQSSLSWSHDGESVLFAAYPPDQNDDRELWLLGITSGTITRLTDNDDEESYPTFSPDGTQIVYSWFNCSCGHALKLMDVASQVSTTLLANWNNHSAASWSPDGKWITFIADTDDLYLMDLNGGGVFVIMPGPDVEQDPVWLTQ